MPDSIVKETLREIEPLHVDDPIGYATRRVLDAGLPALPVVDEQGVFAGVFGEREFMEALFPAYVGSLASARMIRRSVDDSIKLRLGCENEEIREYLTTDEVLVEDDFSDTLLAETFLHHRVLVIPVATNGHVHAVITRNDFFRALSDRVTAARAK